MKNWLKMVSCSDKEFEGLHQELRTGHGLYILDEIQLPESCRNKMCTMEFRYYNEDRITLTCVEAPLEYTGDDTEIATFFCLGTKEFRSFVDLKKFLRRFRSEPTATVDTNPDVRTHITCEEHASSGMSENQSSESERPKMEYDRDNLTVPDTNKTYISVDKDKLILDLNNEIFGQAENISKIAHLVCNHLGTKRKNRPLSVFLYGPPGTGKSAVVEAMVNAINDQLPNKDRLTYRPVDCTQFQDRADISRLTGAAPGYVGFDEPGVFSILEDNSNTVFVFEEIEKAASNATEVIMQAMETGRQETNGKTLGNGKSYYDLSHSIIFFTSNVVISERKNIGFDINRLIRLPEQTTEMQDTNIARIIGDETREAKNLLAQTGSFKREVISRMNAIIKFNELTGDVIKDIAAKCIKDVAANSHILYITRIDTPVLQEFINVTAGEVESFGVRSLRNEAEYYFNDALREYSHNHADYAHIKVTGTLENIIISES